jgi:hypothetical protein
MTNKEMDADAAYKEAKKIASALLASYEKPEQDVLQDALTTGTGLMMAAITLFQGLGMPREAMHELVDCTCGDNANRVKKAVDSGSLDAEVARRLGFSL